MDRTSDYSNRIRSAASERFGAELAAPQDAPALDELARSLEHRSHRKFAARPVTPELLRLLFACALSAPTKSDLQQADIVHVTDRAIRQGIVDTIHDMNWIMDAPVFLVFCANNRRLRQVGQWRGKPYPNEHLDQFMNAAVDTALVLMNFIRAAEASGLGTCPVSHVRNRSDVVSGLLRLPEGVFPVAGLCVGYPAEPGRITPRLPLDITVHVDRFSENNIKERVESYDHRRHDLLPYRRQRYADRYENAPFYGWSEDKARQYSVAERDDFGAFIRKQGFSLK